MRLTFLITAGPTREYVDAVRFLSNASSGKMGYAIAQAAKNLNHNVILVSGPCSIIPPNKINFIEVTSADEMFVAAKKFVKTVDIVIAAAAVSDYKPLKVYKHKIKKTNKYFCVKLKQNPDIIAELSKKYKDKVYVGFALESENIITNAKTKLIKKKLDLIIANSPKSIGANKTDAFFIDRHNKVSKIKNTSKQNLAKRIINESIGIWKNSKTNKKIR